MSAITRERIQMLQLISKGKGTGLRFDQIQQESGYETKQIEDVLSFLMQNGWVVRVNDGCNFYFRISEKGENRIKQEGQA